MEVNSNFMLIFYFTFLSHPIQDTSSTFTLNSYNELLFLYIYTYKGYMN